MTFPGPNAAAAIATALLSPILGAALAACSGTPARTSRPYPIGGTQLNLSIPRWPTTLNPLSIRDPVVRRVTRFVFDGLTRLDGSTGLPVPALAESWEIDPEGKVYTFRIRRGVSWSDREDFGPEDVVFTLNRLIIAEDVPNPYRDLLRVRSKGGDAFPLVERVGDDLVRVTLPAPYPPLLRVLALIPILPKHRLRAPLDLGEIVLAWGLGVRPREVAGTGPFAIEAIRPGEEIRLRRNPYYWERGEDGEILPRLDRLAYRLVPDEVDALLDGKIDLVIADGERLRRLEPLAAAGAISLHRSGPVPEASFLTLRHGEEGIDRIFALRAFRQAVSHALNRDRMIGEALGGLGCPQWSPISRASPYFHLDAVPSYPYDPGRAQDLLEGIGVVDRDGDRIRETPDGIPLSFDLIVGLAPGPAPKIARRIASDLESIGIVARLRPVEPTRLAELIRTGDWDALVLALPEAEDPQLLTRIWSSDEAAHYWRPRQERPATPWEAEIDRLFAAASAERDDARRRDLYLRFQEIAAEEVPLIFTVQRVPVIAVRSRVRNFRPTPVGLLHNIARITVRR